MSSWYRRFLSNFATVTSPLTDLLKKGTKKFKWSDEAEVAFACLKTKLTSAPILANPDYSTQFVIQCDASDIGVGAVLSQGEGDSEKVISFMSQKLTSAQSKYTTTEKECLAVILAVEKFRAYIEGVKFKVITDHSSLLWLQTMKNPSGRLWRWTMRLQQFNFELIHRKGKLNVVPDALSRAIEVASLDKSAQNWYTELWCKVESTGDDCPDYKIQEGKLYRHFARGNVLKWKLVIPPENKDEILWECHDSPLAAHLGFHKTLNRVSREYYWPGMSYDVREYVRSCDTCKSSKSPNVKFHHTIGAPKEAKEPWKLISIDYIGPYPRSREGNTVVLVVTDWFSKFVIAEPMRNSEAKALVKFLERRVFLVFGVPTILWSDNGKQIVSKQMVEFLKSYGVKHYCTPLYAPQSNNTERVNKVLTASIRAYVSKDQRDWDRYVPHIVSAINSASHEATKHTPYFVNFGQNMRLSGENRLGQVGEAQNERKDEWEDEIAKLREEVSENIRQAYVKRSNYYNLRARPVQFHPGEIAWRRNFQLSDATKNIAAKLLPKFIKCKILSGKGAVYEVRDEESKKVGKYHIKDLQKD